MNREKVLKLQKMESVVDMAADQKYSTYSIFCKKISTVSNAACVV